MYNLDTQAREIKRTVNAVGRIIDHAGDMHCPRCGEENTHVVDLVWEHDPLEGDRRRVRMELRCENGGHGYFLFIRNHEGRSRIECAEIVNDASPFAEGARW